MVRFLLAVSFLLALVACRQPPPAAEMRGTVIRPLGSWQGSGSQTIGVVSESGRLRVTWEAKNERDSGGTFRLALHSAVSGRPLQTIVDLRGEGRGSADVADDPRPYNFMVESANMDWSFSVEELVAGPPVMR